MPRPVSLTRIELYELVWTTSLRQLARRFALSDRGLAKLCARYAIPTPPRGYWARLTAGTAPARPPLPTSDDAPEQIQLAVVGDESDAAATRGPSEAERLVASIERPASFVTVLDSLESPHPFTDAAAKRLAGRPGDEDGLLTTVSGCLALNVSPERLPRALRIFDALLRAFTDLGWRCSIKGPATVVEVLGVRIAVCVGERLDRYEIPPPLEAVATERYRFHHDRPTVAARPSGRLFVGLRESGVRAAPGFRRTWQDTEKRQLEGRLTRALVGMVRLADSVHTAKRVREEWQREHEAREDVRSRSPIPWERVIVRNSRP